MSKGVCMANAKNARYGPGKGSISLEEYANDLMSSPNEGNWLKFSAALKKSNAKYYKVEYETLRNREDLTKSFAIIYDSKMKQIAKIPIMIKKGTRAEGAMIYLKELQNANIF